MKDSIERERVKIPGTDLTISKPPSCDDPVEMAIRIQSTGSILLALGLNQELPPETKSGETLPYGVDPVHFMPLGSLN